MDILYTLHRTSGGAWLYPQDIPLETQYHWDTLCESLEVLLSTSISLYMRSQQRSTYVHLIQLERPYWAIGLISTLPPKNVSGSKSL